MKVYLITEKDLVRLKERLELTNLRDNNVMKLPDEDTLNKFEKDSLYRAFVFTFHRWMDEIKQDGPPLT